ncbi:NnrU family protein [Pseudorhodobacter ferrugineus]|uniref:NnrU family protein n=1 Tax=Pseudorhodobacter ferrugineus TaxID=77008 RepID=UPI0003B31804|nr:NnrU family protein [Pseudorhodobacter ferrugineus]
MGWSEYILAAVAFLATHSIPLRPAMRQPIELRIGMPMFLMLYSALSIAALGWLIIAAGRAPYIALWAWAPWQLWVPQVGMALVCLIAALTLGRPNPFSFGGARNAEFNPAQPGLIGWMRHPLLVVLALWAGVHIVPNGDLAHVLMFGSFCLFALLGIVMIDRRRKRNMGAAWVTMRAQTTPWPRPRLSTNAIMRTAIGAAIYIVLIWAHPALFGVYPFG